MSQDNPTSKSAKVADKKERGNISTADSKQATTSLNSTPKASQGSKTSPKPSAPKMISVEISIASKPYTIHCPENETESLKEAVTYINDFVESIRKEAPHINQENLLVLSCLNLYEKMQACTKLESSSQTSNKQAHLMVDRMIKDMQIV